MKPKSRRENHELSYKPIICQSTAFLGWRWIQRVSTFILQHCSRCWSVPLRHPQCWILGQHWKTVLFALKSVLSAIWRIFFPVLSLQALPNSSSKFSEWVRDSELTCWSPSRNRLSLRCVTTNTTHWIKKYKNFSDINKTDKTGQKSQNDLVKNCTQKDKEQFLNN